MRDCKMGKVERARRAVTSGAGKGLVVPAYIFEQAGHNCNCKGMGMSSVEQALQHGEHVLFYVHNCDPMLCRLVCFYSR